MNNSHPHINESSDATIVKQLLKDVRGGILDNVPDYINDPAADIPGESRFDAARVDYAIVDRIEYLLDHWKDVHPYIAEGDIGEAHEDLTR